VNVTKTTASMIFSDVEALGDATETNNGSVLSSNGLFKTKTSQADYGTLELNQFILDGSKTIIPVYSVSASIPSNGVLNTPVYAPSKYIVDNKTLDYKVETYCAANSTAKVNVTPIYTVVWNKITAQMSRADGANNIPTDTTNFKHKGSVNYSYSNPFDNIYPWSERQLCNVDIDKYMAFVAAGTGSIESCVTKWEHGTGIDFADANGVWVYTPEFWHISYDSGSNRYFSVSPTQRNGWVHSPARIAGRWLGIDETRTINSASVHVLLPKVGNPAVNVTFANLHQYAKNYSATLNNCYAYDSDQMLYLVEYANYNVQNTIGRGVDDLYQAGIKFSEAATSSNIVKIPHSDKAIVGAQLDISTASDGFDIARTIITAVSTTGGIDTLTINTAVTVTTSNYANIHGISNVTDASIASMSGYIGTNGRSNAYYRGAVMYGNRWQYLLGLYRHTGDNHVYYANTEAIADTLDALDTSKCTDTGLTLPQGASGAGTEGYIKSLGIKTGILSSPPICTLTGGDSSNPVGDYFYTPSLATGNTVCMVGSYAIDGAKVGSSYANWHNTASDSRWNNAARPILKH